MMRQFAYNAALTLWLLGDAWRCVQAAREGDAVLHLFTASILLVNALFVLRRPAPAESSNTAPRMALVLASVFWPTLYSWAPVARDPWQNSALSLQLAATLVFGWSIIKLGSSFSVFPERRTVVSSGPYSLVRHPIYAAYLMLDLAFCLAQPQKLWMLAWLGEIGLFWFRATWEEKVLSGDELYRAYAAQVRWRFVPGLV